MLDIKKPRGYGIVNTDTGLMFDIWKCLIVIGMVASIFSVVYNFYEKRPLTASLFWLCFCAGIIIFLYIVSVRISSKVKFYHRWCQLLRDAIFDATARIDKMKEDESEREKLAEAHKYKELINFNNGIPIVIGGYDCKRSEDAVYFERSVTFCEQRLHEGDRCWLPMAIGDLQITNKRILFVGESLNREIKIGGVSSIVGYSDGFQISQIGRVRPLLFRCKNGLLPKMVLGYIIQNPDVRLIPESSVIVPKTESEVESDVMEEFLDSLINVSEKISACLRNVSRDPRVEKAVVRLIDRQSVERCNWFDISDKAVGVCAVADLFRSYIRLGHNIEDLTSPEGLSLLLVLSRIFQSEERIDREEWKKIDFRKNMDEKFEPYICQINEILPIDGVGQNLILCDLLLSSGLTQMSCSIASAMYEWAEIVSGADGCISAEEGLWLGVMRGYAKGDSLYLTSLHN